jgi:hypothetical protein
MQDTFINCRQELHDMHVGLIRLLLTLVLVMASLPAFSARNSVPVNSAPVISGTPATSVVAGSSYVFQPAASDADRDRLRFSISNKPAWASFSRRTGMLSGTPVANNVGTYSNIVISVSDRKTSTSMPAFTIRVDAASTSSSNSSSSSNTINSAPVISGTPGTTVVAGAAYSFQPTVNNADADPLSFSISNKPAWASFSSSTGRLSGIPGSGSIGSYDNIVISVSDGIASASLPAFYIEVQAAPVQTGSLTLQWSAPVTRADGTPLSLSEIDGYRIYYGISAGNYPDWVDVADGTAQAVTITDMPAGTYYLVMTTYDVSGNESAYSSMVAKNAE